MQTTARTELTESNQDLSGERAVLGGHIDFHHYVVVNPSRRVRCTRWL